MSIFVVVSFVNVRDQGNIPRVVFVLKLSANDLDKISSETLAHSTAIIAVTKKCFLRCCSILVIDIK